MDFSFALHLESQCPDLSVIQNIEVSSLEGDESSSVVVSCQQGHVFQDGAHNVTLMCTENGQWNNTVPSCQGKIEYC